MLEYVDKEKMLEWLSIQQYNSAEVRNLFKHTAKVVKDFENPKLGVRTCVLGEEVMS